MQVAQPRKFKLNSLNYALFDMQLIEMRNNHYLKTVNHINFSKFKEQEHKINRLLFVFSALKFVHMNKKETAEKSLRPQSIN